MKTTKSQNGQESHLREGERPREPFLRNAQSLPNRHRPASGVFLYPNQPTIVLLNVCTHQRNPWLAQRVVHEALKQVWGEALAWLVGRYVLMPDHLHLFCAPGRQPVPLDRWVSYWKRLFSSQADNPTWRWQVRHWDTRLRSSESYEQKWQYVLQNPVRKGLVARVDDWPYQGELNELRW
jgi:REP-associated tyrosine transposase